MTFGSSLIFAVAAAVKVSGTGFRRHQSDQHTNRQDGYADNYGCNYFITVNLFIDLSFLSFADPASFSAHWAALSWKGFFCFHFVLVEFFVHIAHDVMTRLAFIFSSSAPLVD